MKKEPISINFFGDDIGFRPPEKETEDAGDFSFDGDSEFSPAMPDDNDFVLSTNQLDPELPDDPVIQEMGHPRKVCDNSSGVAASNAEDLADRLLSIPPEHQTRCILRGTFVFGDMLLALAQRLGPVKMTIATLSFSADNVDALYTGFLHGKISSLDFIVSDFFYSHYQWTLWRMLVTNLPREKCRYAVAGSHAKVSILEPSKGPAWVIEGSANLRACQNVEQLLISVGDKESLRFHKLWTGRILQKFELNGKRKLSNQNTWGFITGKE